MPKHKVTIEVDVPEGWEPTGEFRRAEGDLRWLGLTDGIIHAGPTSAPQIILRKVWQPPAWLPEAWHITLREGSKIYFQCGSPNIETCFRPCELNAANLAPRSHFNATAPTLSELLAKVKEAAPSKQLSKQSK